MSVNIKSNDIPPLDISKALENINFEAYNKYSEFKTRKFSKKPIWVLKKEIHPKDIAIRFNSPPLKSQVVTFQQAMKLVFILGQCLGLNPVVGLFQKDVNKMRFTVWNWRFFYSTVIGTIQTTALILFIVRIFRGEPVTIGNMAYFAFYATTSLTTILMMQVSKKWPKLMKKLSHAGLDEYCDPGLKTKCVVATCVIIFGALIEHILSIIATITQIKDCYPGKNVHVQYTINKFLWYSQLDLPLNRVVAVMLQVLNTISTFNWNYSDLYIICLSMYLQSILKQINDRIISASGKRYTQSSYWKSLRVDYTNATRLVRSFDDVINGVTFFSFASNLFFICLQIYNILAFGLKTKPCKNNPQIYPHGFELTLYFVFSSAYLFARSLAVSLITASVHSASLVPATALYGVPSGAYCCEVERFIDQVNSDMVALSGLKFFNVTRELVLSVTGTIVTYELVLLQFNGD